MGGMISKAASSLPSGGGKSSPAPQNAYGSAYQAPPASGYQPSYQAPTSAPAQTGPRTGGPGMGPSGFFGTTPTPDIGMGGGAMSASPSVIGGMGGKSSGMGASGYGMPIQEQASAPQSQSQAPTSMPMMGGKSSGLGQGGYGMAPAFQQPQQQFSPFQQQFGGFQQPQFNPFQQQQFSPFQQQFGGFQQQQFNPFQQQQFNPFQQQFGGFQQQPQGASGLQALFNNMMGQQQQMQQPIQQMPRFQSQALQFRPNMQNAQAALSRVRPSVQRQNQDAQAARIAELEAQLAGYQTLTTSSSDGGGG
jgi:hypothetical protein